MPDLLCSVCGTMFVPVSKHNTATCGLLCRRKLRARRQCEYRQRYPERFRASLVRWRNKNKVKVAASERRRRLKKLVELVVAVKMERDKPAAPA